MSWRPPYTLTDEILTLVAAVSERVGRLAALGPRPLRLRRADRIRTVHGTLAIEGNPLDEEHVTAILEGRPVIAPPRQVQEVRNALRAYERLLDWRPEREEDLLAAHGVIMEGLIDDAGCYRRGGAGVYHGGVVVHVAPPADRVPGLMGDLLAWLGAAEAHPLVAAAVFHYELEFIHPFSDGNGRMGRLWQTLILGRWQPLLAELPVESLVQAHQQAYYRAIEESTERTDCAPFIVFMLERILEASRATPQDTPYVTPHVTPQVRRLLAVLRACGAPMSRQELMAALGLRDVGHFRDRYLRPALEGGWVEMERRQAARSPHQRYLLTARGRAWDERGD